MTAPGCRAALGRRIAEHRRRRGLSQRELGRLVGRSVTWVSQVERGVRAVDRISVLETVAAALAIPLAELAAGTPAAAFVSGHRQETAELRLMLSRAPSLHVPAGRGRHSPAGFRARADRAWSLADDARYGDLSGVLAGLVPDLETGVRAAAAGPVRAELCGLLASAYQACAAVLDVLGEPGAAWVAADRSMGAAERAGDPLLVAAGAFRLGTVFLGARRYVQAEEVSRTAAGAVAPLAAGGTAEAVSVWGGLTAVRAVAAAHAGSARSACGFLGDARAAAAQAGPGCGGYRTGFGPAGIALYEVAAAAALGDTGPVLRAAESADVSGLSVCQRAQLLVDVARARGQRGQAADAAAALAQAEEIAPEYVRACRPERRPPPVSSR